MECAVTNVHGGICQDHRFQIVALGKSVIAHIGNVTPEFHSLDLILQILPGNIAGGIGIHFSVALDDHNAAAIDLPGHAAGECAGAAVFCRIGCVVFHLQRFYQLFGGICQLFQNFRVVGQHHSGGVGNFPIHFQSFPIYGGLEGIISLFYIGGKSTLLPGLAQGFARRQENLLIRHGISVPILHLHRHPVQVMGAFSKVAVPIIRVKGPVHIADVNGAVKEYIFHLQNFDKLHKHRASGNPIQAKRQAFITSVLFGCIFFYLFVFRSGHLAGYLQTISDRKTNAGNIIIQNTGGGIQLHAHKQLAFYGGLCTMGRFLIQALPTTLTVIAEADHRRNLAGHNTGSFKFPDQLGRAFKYNSPNRRG